MAKKYADKVRALEAEGMTTSDAQAVVDAEHATAARPRSKKDAKTLPNRVRQHREKVGLSPKALAAKIGGGWTASTVRRIERGARKPTPEHVAHLSDALQVPATKLGIALPAIPPEPRAKSVPGKAASGRVEAVSRSGEVATA